MPPYPLGIWTGGIGSPVSTALPHPVYELLISFILCRLQSNNQCSWIKTMSANLLSSLKTGSHVLIFLQLKVTMFSLLSHVDAFSDIDVVRSCTKKLRRHQWVILLCLLYQGLSHKAI